MLLEKFIPQLIKDLELGTATLGSGVPGVYSLPLEKDLAMSMTDIPDGFILKSAIAPFPGNKQELFATQALLANLFGQGTHDAVLGIDSVSNQVTVTLVIDFPLEYMDFKGILEDFMNTIDLWRDEALHPPK